MAGSGTKNAAWVSWLQKEGFRQARWELHLYLQLWHVNAEPKRSTRVNAISYDRLDITQSLGNSIQAPDFMSCKRHAMKVWHGRLTSNLNFQADCNPPSLPTHFQPICYLSLLPLHFFLFFDWRNCHRGLLLPRTWWAALRRTRPPRVGGKTGGKTSAKLKASSSAKLVFVPLRGICCWFTQTIKKYDHLWHESIVQKAAHFASNTTFLGCLRCKHILLSTSDSCTNTYCISLLYTILYIGDLTRLQECQGYRRKQMPCALWSVSALRFKAHQRRVWC